MTWLRTTVLAVLMTCGSLTTAEELPFAPGESLRYQIVWKGVPVGYLTVRVRPMGKVEDKPAWQFAMVAETNSFADKIYKIRLYINSYMAQDLTCSYRYRANKRQGSSKKIQLLDFDWEKMKVHYTKNNVIDRGWRDVPEKSVDPLGMFYVLRKQKIDDNTQELAVWVSDGKRHAESKARIVKREKIRVNGKKYNTVLIEPDTKDLRGVFQKSKDAKLQIWLSTDKDRIPVRISSSVVVGSFIATLVEHKKGS